MIPFVVLFAERHARGSAFTLAALLPTRCLRTQAESPPLGTSFLSIQGQARPRGRKRRCFRSTKHASTNARGRATRGAGASANARSHACRTRAQARTRAARRRTQVRARRVRPCDVGRGRKAFYSWNSAMAAKGSQNTKITTNGQRWALLTATYSRMNAVGQK